MHKVDSVGIPTPVNQLHRQILLFEMGREKHKAGDNVIFILAHFVFALRAGRTGREVDQRS